MYKISYIKYYFFIADIGADVCFDKFVTGLYLNVFLNGFLASLLNCILSACCRDDNLLDIFMLVQAGKNHSYKIFEIILYFKYC